MNQPNSRMEIQQEYMQKSKDLYENSSIKQEVEQKYRETDF